MPTLGVPWWRRPRSNGIDTLRVVVIPQHGEPLSYDAHRRPAQDHANGIRVYVCELPTAVFRNLPHSDIRMPNMPGMSEVQFVEAGDERRAK